MDFPPFFFWNLKAFFEMECGNVAVFLSFFGIEGFFFDVECGNVADLVSFFFWN